MYENNVNGNEDDYPASNMTIITDASDAAQVASQSRKDDESNKLAVEENEKVIQPDFNHEAAKEVKEEEEFSDDKEDEDEPGWFGGRPRAPMMPPYIGSSGRPGGNGGRPGGNGGRPGGNGSSGFGGFGQPRPPR